EFHGRERGFELPVEMALPGLENLPAQRQDVGEGQLSGTVGALGPQLYALQRVQDLILEGRHRIETEAQDDEGGADPDRNRPAEGLKLRPESMAPRVRLRPRALPMVEDREGEGEGCLRKLLVRFARVAD